MPKGKARMFTDQEVEQMAIEMLENQLTTDDIAQNHDCCSATVAHNFHKFLSVYNPTLYQEVKEYMHQIKFGGRPRIFSDEELVAIANEMLEKDLSSKDLGRKYYVVSSTILYNFHVHLKRCDPELYQKIYQHLQDIISSGMYGRKDSKMGRRRLFTDEELKNIAVDMMENGLTAKEASEKHFVEYTSLLYMFHNYLRSYDPDFYEELKTYLSQEDHKHEKDRKIK
jgi:hypothetical protein